MFEQVEWSDGPVPAGPLCDDEPELTDADYQAMVEALIAADPDARPAPSAAQIIARGESEPMGPGLITALWRIDATGLDRDDRIGLTVGCDRAVNALMAKRAIAVAATLHATPEVPGWMCAEQVAAGDLGGALHLGAGGIDDLLDVSVTLGQRLPGTLAAVSRGDVSWGKAATLAHAIASLTDSQARAVEARVLPHAATRTPAQHQAAVRRAVDTIDPAGADERRRQARKDVMLARQHLADGMGELYARMTSEQLDIIWAGADHWARSRKAAGDERTLDQLRVAALVNWATSLLSHGDATYCDRICTNNRTGNDAAGGDDGPDTDDEPADPSGDGDPHAGGPDDNGPDGSRPGDDGGLADDGDAPAGDDATDGDVTEFADTEPAKPEPSEPALANPPVRHGRAAVVAVEWDLTSLLGLTNHCGRLTASGATLPPAAMRELLASGVRTRRLLIDPTTGELLDLTATTWTLPPTDGSPHRQPIELRLVVDGPPGAAENPRLLDDYDVRAGLSDELTAALPELKARDPHLAVMLEQLLAAPITSASLDDSPDAAAPPAPLAGFVTARDAHPVNPCAGLSDAAAADIDHNIARSRGGLTIRINLASLTRRWHRLKTHAGWTTRPITPGWLWTSPTGRTYTTAPHDYRLGP